MMDLILSWLWNNKIEFIGAILGLLYILFSVRQHIFTWPTGILTSIFYSIIFFRSGFYADMSLQLYYVVISIYGWYFWLRGGSSENSDLSFKAPVRRLTGKIIIYSIVVTIAVFILYVSILKCLTDSTIPIMDSLTTALSITATWMLAKKYIEHWLIWIFVDLFSAGLYIYKELWPTALLFIIYAIMAIVGYREWKKELIEE